MAKAKKILSDAGIKTPVNITVGYTPTHYGPNAVDEATEFQRQLEDERAVQGHAEERRVGAVPDDLQAGRLRPVALGWFPDYLDADNYLSPFMVDGGSSPTATRTRGQQARRQGAGHDRPEPSARRSSGSSRTSRPRTSRSSRSWVGQNIAVYGKGMKGVEDTLDPAFIFRFWLITKNELSRLTAHGRGEGH